MWFEAKEPYLRDETRRVLCQDEHTGTIAAVVSYNGNYLGLRSDSR